MSGFDSREDREGACWHVGSWQQRTQEILILQKIWWTGRHSSRGWLAPIRVGPSSACCPSAAQVVLLQRRHQDLPSEQSSYRTNLSGVAIAPQEGSTGGQRWEGEWEGALGPHSASLA